MKKYIVAILLILLLVVLGIFYYQKHFIKNTTQQIFVSDFVVTTTPTEKIVTNKKAGVIMKVSGDWGVGKPEQSFVKFVSPQYLKNTGTCQFDVSIDPLEELSSLKEKMSKDFHDTFSKDEILNEKYDFLTIQGRQSLKSYFDNTTTGGSIVVDIFLKDKLFSVSAGFADKDKDYCSQALDSFIANITFDEK